VQAPVNYAINCNVGSYTVTGKASTLLVAHKLTCAVGSYAVIGSSATFTSTINLSCETGNYYLTGFPATFSLTINYILPCLNGSYTLTGTGSYIQYYKGIWALESDTILDAWLAETTTPNVWTTETTTPITWN
jgi:hypothetical protein